MNGDRQHNNEASPLLGSHGDSGQPGSQGEVHNGLRARRIVWTTLTVLVLASLVFLVGFVHLLSDKIAPWIGLLPKNPDKAALVILEQAPVIDGHIDLPNLVRAQYANNASAVDLQSAMPGHVDIPRLRTGRVGGFFFGQRTLTVPNKKKKRISMMRPGS